MPATPKILVNDFLGVVCRAQTRPSLNVIDLCKALRLLRSAQGK